MKKNIRNIVCIAMALLISVSLAACGSGNGGAGGASAGNASSANSAGASTANSAGASTANSAGASANAPDATFKLAYQYGIQYLPAKIVQDQKLIQKYYPGNVEVTFQTMGSGAEINEGIISGSLDAGLVGTSVAITGVSKGVTYKVFSGISNIPNRLVSNKESLKTLKDFTPKDKIALVSIGSIQHLLLAMAQKKQLGDAHALDTNIMGMKHPDGMQALVSGSVQAHMTTSPYDLEELEMPGMHEIPNIVEDGLPGGSLILGVMSTKIQDENPALAEAVRKAFAEAMSYISDANNLDAIAEASYENEGLTKEKMLGYLQNPDTQFDAKVTGLMTLAKFMDDEDFLDGSAPTDPSAYFFDGVEHEN